MSSVVFARQHRNAVADGTVAELKQRAIRLSGRPDCEDAEALPDARMRITCNATTATGMPVTVVGTAGEVMSERPRELYVITVDGHELVREDCLGCRHPNPAA